MSAQPTGIVGHKACSLCASGEVVDTPELRDRMEDLLLEILKHCAVLEELGVEDE